MRKLGADFRNAGASRPVRLPSPEQRAGLLKWSGSLTWTGSKPSARRCSVTWSGNSESAMPAVDSAACPGLEDVGATQAVPVAALAAGAAVYARSERGKLSEAAIAGWLVDAGFAVPAGDGCLRPTQEARDVVELMRGH